MGRMKTLRERERKHVKQKFIISNLVYGQLYPQLWLDNHVKSIMDPTNIPALKELYDVEYALFTDEETLQGLSRHPNFIQLSQMIPIHVIKIGWPPDSDRFASRYGVLVEMLRKAIPVALEQDAWLTCIVADLVFAKEALPRMLKPMERGHDAVFMVPIRCAADSVNQLLAKLPFAPTDLELFEMAYANLHHLWVAADWHANLFTKFPYSIVFNSGTGLLTHNFGVTPIVFKPTKEMETLQGGIDSDLPSFCKNPYWATDWTEAPVAGVEPLSNGHWPPFLQHKANFPYIVEWSNHLKKTQVDNLEHPLYYPSKKTFADSELAALALKTMKALEAEIRTKSKHANPGS